MTNFDCETHTHLLVPWNLVPHSNGGNPMRSLDDAIDLKQILAKHYDPALAEARILEVHQILGPSKAALSVAERVARGWEEAYDLRPWAEFPNSEGITMTGIVLQNLSGGWFRNGGGPTAASKDVAVRMREAVLAMAVRQA